MFVKESHFDIALADESGAHIPTSLDCVAKYWNEDKFSRRTCAIKLRFGNTELEAVDRDFFEAFCRLREQLAKLGLHALCYGASRNVYPSGMLRDMGDGLKAYRLQMGQRSDGDMVGIFESGPDVDPVPVEMQRHFYEAWRQSFGSATEQIVGREPR